MNSALVLRHLGLEKAARMIVCYTRLTAPFERKNRS